METSNGEEFPEVLDQPKEQKIYTLPLQLWVSVVIVRTFYFTYSIQHKDIYVDSINKCSFHWILIVFDLSDGHLLIYDSLRKPQEDYQDMIDIIQG